MSFNIIKMFKQLFLMNTYRKKAEKSKRKESEPQEDTDQKADEDKAQGDVREGKSLPNTHDLNPTREAPYRVV